MSNNKPQYAFYSLTQEKTGKNIIHENSNGKAEKRVRYNIYELISGKEVKVTEVNSRIDYANISNFSDMVCQGEIKRWVRVVYWD